MERNPQLSSLRVQKGISYGLGTDSEDFITPVRVNDFETLLLII
jgi:hypothetical protein